MVYEIIPTELGSFSSPIYPKQPGLFLCSNEDIPKKTQREHGMLPRKDWGSSSN